MFKLLGVRIILNVFNAEIIAISTDIGEEPRSYKLVFKS